VKLKDEEEKEATASYSRYFCENSHHAISGSLENFRTMIFGRMNVSCQLTHRDYNGRQNFTSAATVA
jgi:hypothetical protein